MYRYTVMYRYNREYISVYIVLLYRYMNYYLVLVQYMYMYM